MADNRKYVQNQSTTLAGAGASATDTSVILSSLTKNDGTLITMSDLGTKGYGTIEPGNGAQEEAITFTGITQNANGTATLTGVSNQDTVSPYTETSGLNITHAGGTTFVLTNTAGFYDGFLNKNDDETIVGKYTFPAGASANAPVSGTVYSEPVDDLEYASKKYVDDIAIQGSPKATNTVYGISKLSVAAVVATEPIAVGDNDNRVSPVSLATLTSGKVNALAGNGGTPSASNTYVTQAGLQTGTETFAVSTTGNDTYVITLDPAPTAYVQGMTIRFKADAANTGACSLNVNGLGAVPIQKKAGTDLDTNDIVAGQIVEVVYNDVATDYFQMIGASLMSQANVTDLTDAGATSLHYHASALGVSSRDLSAASGAQTFAHGLGYTPHYVVITINYVVGGNTLMCIGSYNGSSQRCIYTVDSGAVTSGNNNSAVAFCQTGAGATQTGVASVDSTNITITWTKANSPSGTAYILWEAQ